LSRLVTALDAVYPTRLGVDEIAYWKGHNYLTVVRDPGLGKVIWVVQRQTGKKTVLDAFFKELGETKSSPIRVFVMDTYVGSIHRFCTRKHER
jgi:transposase